MKKFMMLFFVLFFTFCANAQDDFSQNFSLVDTLYVDVPENFYSSYFYDLYKLERMYESEFEFYDFDSVLKHMNGIEKIKGEKCVDFLKSKNAVLLGFQGLSLVFQQRKDKFPEQGWIYSLYDHKSKEISENCILPCAYKGKKLEEIELNFGLWGFGLGYSKISPDYVLAFFSQ